MDKLNVKYGVSSHICNRKYMEDYHNHYIDKNLIYFNILDGHGDYTVAEYVNKIFLKKLKKCIHKLNYNNYKLFFTDICLEIDDEIKNCVASYKKSGSTYIGVIIHKNYLYVVNIGDSIININSNNSVVFENIKHVPINIVEKSRIEQAKFKVTDNGRINNCINISRCFGDYAFKPYYLKDINPIIAYPDVNVFDLNVLLRNNTFILLASDGILLQKNVSLKFINKFIFQALKKHKPQIICDFIVNYYVKNNNTDNITIYIILL